jgi:hypothetical protein
MRVLQPGEDRLCRPHSLREGGATPAWLASYFDASRRIATIVAQIVKLVQKLTDDAVLMFIKPCCSPRSTTKKKQLHGVRTRAVPGDTRPLSTKDSKLA